MWRVYRLNAFAKLALVFAAVWLALLIAGAMSWGKLRQEVEESAQAEADRAVGATSDQLDEIDNAFGPFTRAEASELRLRIRRLGPPSLRPGVAGPPALRFGSRTVGDQQAAVDGVAASLGGAAILYVRVAGAFAPSVTSVKNAAGGRDLGASIDRDSVAYGVLQSGRSFAGPLESRDQVVYAHLTPILNTSGRVIGAYAAQYPLEALEGIVRQVPHSPGFSHGILVVVDQRGKLVLRSSTLSPGRLSEVVAALLAAGPKRADPAHEYRLLRAAQDRRGRTVAAAVYTPDLTLRTIRLVGASVSAPVVVIVLALCLAWLMARRLTSALAEAQINRVKAEAARAALAGELERAAKYVESLLPKPTRDGPVEAEWLYQPSVRLGGDAFGYHWLDDNRFAFYLLDVCGHGVGAALLATTVMNVLRGRTEGWADFSSPTSVLTALNRAFQMDAQDGMYFTIWYGVYDDPSRQVTYAAAGQHPAILLAPKAAPLLLQGRGLPIGCLEHVAYPSFTAAVPPGARMYLFSDGIFEIELKNRHQMFTFDEFVDVIVNSRKMYGDRDLHNALEVVQDLQGKREFDDDCALMALAFKGRQSAEIAA